MLKDSDRVVLKRNYKIFIDGMDTGWTWVKVSGFHSEYQMRDEKRVLRVNHYSRKTFVSRLLDFYTGCGEFL